MTWDITWALGDRARHARTCHLLVSAFAGCLGLGSHLATRLAHLQAGRQAEMRGCGSTSTTQKQRGLGEGRGHNSNQCRPALAAPRWRQPDKQGKEPTLAISSARCAAWSSQSSASSATLWMVWSPSSVAYASLSSKVWTAEAALNLGASCSGQEGSSSQPGTSWPTWAWCPDGPNPITALRSPGRPSACPAPRPPTHPMHARTTLHIYTHPSTYPHPPPTIPNMLCMGRAQPGLPWRSAPRGARHGPPSPPPRRTPCG